METNIDFNILNECKLFRSFLKTICLRLDHIYDIKGSTNYVAEVKLFKTYRELSDDSFLFRSPIYINNSNTTELNKIVNKLNEIYTNNNKLNEIVKTLDNYKFILYLQDVLNEYYSTKNTAIVNNKIDILNINDNQINNIDPLFIIEDDSIYIKIKYNNNPLKIKLFILASPMTTDILNELFKSLYANNNNLLSIPDGGSVNREYVDTPAHAIWKENITTEYKRIECDNLYKLLFIYTSNEYKPINLHLELICKGIYFNKYIETYNRLGITFRLDIRGLLHLFDMVFMELKKIKDIKLKLPNEMTDKK